VDVLLVMLLPTLIFGIFALLCVWFGAESRPWFDERPVTDERPNWPPLVRSIPVDEESSAPDDGAPAPVPAPAKRQRPAAATSAAISPSGV
jgi:hypothetical protein